MSNNTMDLFRYLVTYDIKGASDDPKNYHDARHKLDLNIEIACRDKKINSYKKLESVSTTYLIKSILNISQIKELFKKSTDVSFNFIVVKYSEYDGELSSIEKLQLHIDDY